MAREQESRTVRTSSEEARTPARILVADDDQALQRAIARALELEGYDVVVASDGLEALEFFDGNDDPDLVVLDILMPMLDGLATCRALRARSRVPILILTARHDVHDRVEGLDAGADDYLGKPFAVVELTARVRALLRRANPDDDVLRYDDLELDRSERRGRRAARQFDLT